MHEQTCCCKAQAQPGFAKARVRLATCHMRLGRFAPALAALEAPPFMPDTDLAAKRAEVQALQARHAQASSPRALPCHELLA